MEKKGKLWLSKESSRWSPQNKR